MKLAGRPQGTNESHMILFVANETLYLVGAYSLPFGMMFGRYLLSSDGENKTTRGIVLQKRISASPKKRYRWAPGLLYFWDAYNPL